MIDQIKSDQKLRKNIEEPLSIDILDVDGNSDKSTRDLNGKFVYFQLLLYLILQIKPNDDDTKELFDLYRQEYFGNTTELENISKFEKTYEKKEALSWYSKESFFYKTLNKALRRENIHLIYLLRSYIVDICNQIEINQSYLPCEVYRYQLISKDELNHFFGYIGQYISVNSFLSTTMREDVANFYMGMGQCSDEFERVLFHIDANPNRKRAKPFANISLQSEFFNEFEVLFTLGSIFRLDSIQLGEGHLYQIHLTLCGEEEDRLRVVFDQMREQYQKEEVNLETLAQFLLKMGQFQLAEKYYLRLINQLPSDDPSLIHLYENLAQIASQQKQFDKSMQWQRKLLSLKQQSVQSPPLNEGISFQPSSCSEDVVKKSKKYPSGDVYDGEFVNGLYHGYGIYSWINGDRYEGMWKNNRREGEGMWLWGKNSSSPGDRYQGQWHDDQKNGYGKYIQADGDIYMGSFQNDQRHGSGIYQKADGKTFNVVYDHDDLISSEEIRI